MDSRSSNYHRNHNDDDDDGDRNDNHRHHYKHRKYQYHSERIRYQNQYDNQTSNSQSSSISSIVANHYNSIHNNDIQERKKSRIYYMRNFNNWVKSIIIRDTIKLLRSERDDQNDTEFIVHDLACGKGGDLTKYEKSQITHFIGSDIASVSIEHCKERYGNSRKYFKAEFINADCSRELIKDKLSDPNIRFDMTSCQFSFHYCFESYDQVRTMVRNASECLKIGGIFCGTMPDSIEVMRRLKECGTNQFGNDVYSIKFDKSYDEMTAAGISLFGAKYDFHLEEVVDCPEFLVYFPIMEEICESYGLKLIFKKRFDEFYEENREGDDNSRLLNFMEALEKYPPKDRERPMGKPEDYRHIREYLQNSSGQSINTIGTLSKSEWEAVTLYLVFSFRKVF
ncbi:RNA guanine-7 methyltransferase [Dermatophagoides farinae]|uniref:RNA guanine-7 methyltransferase n=1 Tax=Dermatophagoides farinae TaxID=6954 RepID=UPI003F5D8DB1